MYWLYCDGFNFSESKISVTHKAVYTARNPQLETVISNRYNCLTFIHSLNLPNNAIEKKKCSNICTVEQDSKAKALTADEKFKNYTKHRAIQRLRFYV